MSLKSRLLRSPNFQAFVTKVAAVLSQLSPERSGVVPALERERLELESACEGYLLSLGKKDLPATLRESLEAKYDQAQNRIGEINRELDELTHFAETKKAAVAPEDIADALSNLGGVLDSQNAAAMNILLAQHIDRIDCHPDGQVHVRTCQLGAMAQAKDLLVRYGTEVSDSMEGNAGGENRIEPRRRSRRDIGIGIEDEDEAEAANNFAADPGRFGDLGPEWFSVDEFLEPAYHSWAATNAGAVAEHRLSWHATEAETARHFDKSIPTIRAALRIAKSEHGIDALGKSVSRPSRVPWPEANAQAVAQYLSQPGRLLRDAVEHFDKSEPTIRKARDIGRSQCAAS